MELRRPEENQRLSRIVTLWTMVRQAHEPPNSGDAGGGGVGGGDAARSLLMERYYAPAHAYLVRALRDEDAADEVFQEFALRFLRGDFRNTRPGRGRFRDYLRAVLINLVNDYHRARQRRPLPLTQDVPAQPRNADQTNGADDDDPQFIDSWRSSLMDRAWMELEASSPQHYAVLLHYVTNPQSPAAEGAAAVARQLGKTMTPENFRVTLHRARRRFAEALVAEVATSLGQPTLSELREELASLRLDAVCATAVEHWAKQHAVVEAAPSAAARS